MSTLALTTRAITAPMRDAVDGFTPTEAEFAVVTIDHLQKGYVRLQLSGVDLNSEWAGSAFRGEATRTDDGWDLAWPAGITPPDYVETAARAFLDAHLGRAGR
jgi:hypothetical protein